MHILIFSGRGSMQNLREGGGQKCTTISGINFLWQSMAISGRLKPLGPAPLFNSRSLDSASFTVCAASDEKRVTIITLLEDSKNHGYKI